MVILQQVFDALDEALMVWHPDSERLELANAKARKSLVRKDGGIVSAAVMAAREHRQMRIKFDEYQVRAPACRFQQETEFWFLRSVGLQGALELLICNKEVMRERRLLQAMQKIYAMTDRQTDVLQHLVKGHSTNQTAKLLRIAPRTVQKHEAALRDALGVANNYEVLRLVGEIRRGNYPTVKT